ncbi:MAG: diacylglycerol kinase, partial [Pseudomonadales bacterium]
CIVLFPLAFVISEHFITATALISICLIVLAVELLNSGIEAAIDRSGLEFHPLAKQAKDFGSAAVFLTLIAAGIIWFAVLIDYLMRGPA